MENHSIRQARYDARWASAIMRTLEKDLACAIHSDASVMISGESGTGKKFIAHLIHLRSRRSAAPFVIAKCHDLSERFPRSASRSLPAMVFEHGLLKTTARGTLLIDEIQKIPAAMQLQLLQSIERELTNGAHSRLMTAVDTDLFERVRSNQFRSDLFYRLNVIHLIVPPLRDRREDIPILLDHYLSVYATAGIPRFSKAALQRLLSYRWPGNVRELKSAAEALAVQDPGRRVEVDDLPSHIH
jgi:two-component system, NtrC family, response regulator AtoC